MTYDEQLQAYVFTYTKAIVPAKNYMYVIFHEPIKKKFYFKYNPLIRQLRLIGAKDCDWTTRCLLCKELIFNQMTDQTNYVRQNRTELELDYDQITGQRHDSYVGFFLLHQN